MWYTVKIIYKSMHYKNKTTVKNIRTMYEELIILIRASGEKDVIRKARIISRNNEAEYFNDKNEKIKWKAIKIFDVQEIGTKLTEGAELSTRYFHNISSYRKFDKFFAREGDA